MGDIGDYWSEAREYRRDARSMWIECSSPGCQFGGNPVKVAPGRKCHHCGEIAPGERGSDTRYARRQEQSRFLTEAEREEEQKKLIQKRTCTQCGKRLRSKQGRLDHERDVHGIQSRHP
jgi:hypothetical protein